ncbi:cationic amino acid transporter 8, vacuolar [Senna tora]|uniref:Cationic amino acid transporter 8, vacuolar n=1 Tax=Senna tora TaxID=362788 RepID=A0A834WMR5_9FABA|nr:cationic amino acid transporter 8, vacuolar [Senna tora]
MNEPSRTADAGRSYWRWRKQDLFPGDSFQSLQSYRKAMSQTCPRLADRLTSRSTDDYEILELPKASENDMKKCLTWWDLMWLSFGAVVGSGIFVITGQEARDNAGPAIVLSYAASGLSALLSAFCYTEFAVEVPVAGGSFSFLRIELGDFVAYIAAGNIILEALVGAAGLGRSWSSYFSTMIKNDPDFLRIRVDSFREGFNLLDPLAVVVLFIANGIAMSGTRRTSILNWLSSIATTLVIVFIIVVGFLHAKASNLDPFFPFGAKGVFEAAAVVFWSYTGFDMVATMAEETKNPSTDIPVGLIGSMTMITTIYCLMALALTMMQKYTEIDRDAAYSVAFIRIGMNWAKYLVSICALKGMTTSLLAGSLGQARYMTQIARSHMIPPLFALVHPRTGTPVNATLLITLSSAVVALFSSLDVLSSVFSISTLFIFTLMAIALLIRRYYVRETTSKSDLMRVLLCLFVIIGSCAGGTTFWSSDKLGWIGYTVAAFVWFLATLVMSFLPMLRMPKVWGVPLVPWLPSLSIAMNVFLMGSLGAVAFWRFAICSALMLVYYLFVVVHTTYDVAHENKQKTNVEGKEDNNQEVLKQSISSVLSIVFWSSTTYAIIVDDSVLELRPSF